MTVQFFAGHGTCPRQTGTGDKKVRYMAAVLLQSYTAPHHCLGHVAGQCLRLNALLNQQMLWELGKGPEALCLAGLEFTRGLWQFYKVTGNQGACCILVGNT